MTLGTVQTTSFCMHVFIIVSGIIYSPYDRDALT